MCLSGTGECTFEDNPPERYRAGSVLVIPAGTRHTLRNVGADRLIQLAVLAGPNPDTRWVASEGSVTKSRR